MKKGDYMNMEAIRNKIESIDFEKDLHEAHAKELFEDLKAIDSKDFISFYKNDFDWEKYFKERKKRGKSFGYFVYGRKWRQVVFQYVRPWKTITRWLFPVVNGMPDSFFSEWLEYEKDSWLKHMIPRGIEVLENVEFYKDFYSRLTDKKSKWCLLNLIFACITMDYEYYSKAREMTETDYWPKDIVDNFEEEINGAVIDCGGFDGDTALDFFKRYSLRNDNKYYLVEADGANIEKAKKQLENYDNIVYLEAAASDKGHEAIQFLSSGAGGSIDAKGDIKVLTVALDEEIEERIAYIKMDIEGGEAAALKGTVRHIRDDKPFMAICAYHKPDDIRVLTKIVCDVCDDYNVYIRHYGDKFKETVIYFYIK